MAFSICCSANVSFGFLEGDAARCIEEGGCGVAAVNSLSGELGRLRGGSASLVVGCNVMLVLSCVANATGVPSYVRLTPGEKDGGGDGAAIVA